MTIATKSIVIANFGVFFDDEKIQQLWRELWNYDDDDFFGKINYDAQRLFPPHLKRLWVTDGIYNHQAI